MYLALKHTHMLLAIISILGFVLRSGWLFRNSALLNKKPTKILPHIIDTFLLLSGICLMVLTSQYPATFNWLSVKILLIIAYILFGMMTFKAATKTKQFSFFLLAIISVGTVLFLAHNKPLLF